MGDRDVHDALHSGVYRRVEEGPRVRHGRFVVDAAVGETNPIGVVERRRSSQRLDQARGVIEVEGSDVDAVIALAPSGDVP